jgi:hypothetical protein
MLTTTTTCIREKFTEIANESAHLLSTKQKQTNKKWSHFKDRNF